MFKTKLFNFLFASTTLSSILIATFPQSALTQTPPEAPESIILPGTIRDFKAYRLSDKSLNEGGHRDFQRYESEDPEFTLTSERGVIVEDTIGEDNKPVYKPGAEGSKTTTTKTNFDMWYRDVPGVNMSMSYPITLRDPDGDGVYTFARNLTNDQSFFPIDGKLFGNEGYEHNYHFTYEIHTEFTYVPGTEESPRVFTFKGDDDVFVFINKKKVIDLGGIHAEETQSVNLDEVASTIGLEEGETYELSLFFAERNVVQSNFQIDTSIVFENIVYAD